MVGFEILFCYSFNNDHLSAKSVIDVLIAAIAKYIDSQNIPPQLLAYASLNDINDVLVSIIIPVTVKWQD